MVWRDGEDFPRLLVLEAAVPGPGPELTVLPTPVPQAEPAPSHSLQQLLTPEVDKAAVNDPELLQHDVQDSVLLQVQVVSRAEEIPDTCLSVEVKQLVAVRNPEDSHLTGGLDAGLLQASGVDVVVGRDPGRAELSLPGDSLLLAGVLSNYERLAGVDQQLEANGSVHLGFVNVSRNVETVTKEEVWIS